MYGKKQTKLLLAVGLASLIGGMTGAIVLAAIPDSNGTIHGCYRNSTGLTNSKGSLRVIDSDNGDTCTNQETPLSWKANSSNGYIAYAHLVFNSSTNSWTLDTSRSKNVTNIYSDPNTFVCLTVSQVPKSIAASNESSGGTPVVSIKDQNGWSSDAIGQAELCDQNAPGSNVFFYYGTNSGQTGSFITVF